MANISKAIHNINVTRGDDWSYEIPVFDSSRNPQDWTGWANAKSQVRRKVDDETFIIEFAGADIELTTGKIVLKAASAVTADIDPFSYVYDIEADTPSGNKLTFIAGAFTVESDVTRG